MFLDTVRIPWWDTELQLAREAIIPARRINVGLPDRANVLSKLALEESGISRLKFQLQTANPLRLLSHIAAGIALVYLLWCLVPYILNRSPHQRHLNQHLRHLKTIAHRGDARELYQTLMTPYSRQLLQGAERELVSRLETLLFSNHADAHPRQERYPLSHWLKAVIKKARQTNELVTTDVSDGLAEL